MALCLLAALCAGSVRASTPLLKGDALISATATAAASAAVGTKKLLVVRVDFPDVIGDPVTLTSATRILSDSVVPYFRRASGGNMLLDATVSAKTYRLPSPSTVYTVGGDRDRLHADARTAAAADYTLAGYDFVMVVFARLSSANVVGLGFEFGGLADLGGSRTWINGRENFVLRVIAHELGHNLGLGHANSVTAADWPLLLGNSLEYGDTEDVMGSGSGAYNPALQARLGWLADAAIATPATGTHVVRLYTATESTGAVKPPVAARFAGANGLRYWVFPRASGSGTAVAIVAAADAGDTTAAVITDTPNGPKLLLEAGDYFTDLDTATVVSVQSIGAENGIPYADCAITLPDVASTVRLTAPLTVTDASNGVRIEASSNDPGATVQWQKRVAGGSTWAAIETGDLVAQPSPTAVVVRRDTGIADIRVVLSNAAGQAMANPLRLVAAPVLAPASMSVGAGQQRYFLGVNASGAWSLSTDRDWVTLVPNSGTGPQEVTVMVKTNLTGAPRQALVRSGSITHAIAQSAAADEANAVFSTGTAALGPQVSTVNQPIQLGAGFTGMSSPGIYSKSDGSRWALGRQMMKNLSADWLTVSSFLVDRTASIGRLIRVPDDVAAFANDRNNGSRYLVLKKDGSLYSNSSSVAGPDGSYVASKVADHAAKLACGSTVAAFIDTQGGLWAWGQNYFGEVGDGTTTARTAPVLVAASAVDVSTATHQHWFITSTGELKGVGKQCYSELGTPQGFDTNVRKVAAGGVHTLILRTDGSVWAVGRNVEGQLGDGTWASRDTPVQIATGISDIAAGLNTSYLLRSDGVLLSAGWNQQGQLGDGTRTNRNRLLAIDRNVASIFEDLYLKTDGTLWATGGQLSDPPAPRPVDRGWYQAGGAAVQVAAGRTLSWMLDAAGRLYAAGMAQDGDAPAATEWQLVESDVQEIIPGNGGSEWLAFKKTNGETWSVAWSVQYQWMRLNFGAGAVRVAFPCAPGFWSEAYVVKADGTLWQTTWTIDSAGTTGVPAYVVPVAGRVISAGHDAFFVHYVTTDGVLYRLTKSGGASRRLAANVAEVQITGDGTGYFRTADRRLYQFVGDGAPAVITEAVASFSGGPSQVMFQTDDGALWGVGSDGQGLLGTGASGASILTPTLIASQAAAYAVGSINTLVLARASALAHAVSAPTDNAPVCHTPAAAQSVALAAGASRTLTTMWTFNAGAVWRWYKDGVELPNGTANSYKIAAATATDAGRYTCRATTAAGTTESLAYTVTVGASALPLITLPPRDLAVRVGDPASFTVEVTSPSACSYQWFKNGLALAGATTATLSLNSAQVTDTGSYTLTVTNTAGSATANAGTLTVAALAAQVAGTGTLVGHDIVHPRGNIFDQVLLTGPAVTVTAEAHKVTRVSFIDLHDDIVQVEFSGAGALTVLLDNATGPAAPVKYNQPGVGYMKGHASIIITGADETTNVSVFSVGTATATNSALFKSGEVYDGIADLALLSIASADGKFGGIRLGNGAFFGATGFTGIYAPAVAVQGPTYLEDLTADGAAVPVLLFGSTTDVRITGGDLLQLNSAPVEVDGITRITFTAGATSAGVALPAQTNRARFEKDGVDVTAQLVPGS